MKLIDPKKIRFAMAPIAPFLVGNSVHYEWIAFRDEVNQIPIIEAEPVKHAHWVPCEDEYEDEYKCSACGGTQFFAMTPQDEGWEYCPHCGAKMDEKTDD